MSFPQDIHDHYNNPVTHDLINDALYNTSSDLFIDEFKGNEKNWYFMNNHQHAIREKMLWLLKNQSIEDKIDCEEKTQKYKSRKNNWI